MHIVDVALGETPDTQVPYDIPVAALPVTIKGWPQALVFARASRASLSDVIGKRSESYLLLMDGKGDLAYVTLNLDVAEPGRKRSIRRSAPDQARAMPAAWSFELGRGAAVAQVSRFRRRSDPA
jgi:hypothetical protein